MPIYDLISEDETKAFAAQLAQKASPRDIFLLEGDLGAGKSVFARSFIQSLCGENTEVPSPTFTLVQTYDSSKGQIWHFDLYRLKDPDEVFNIGWEDALNGGIVLVEWPSRLGIYKPKLAVTISFVTINENSRRIIIE